MRRLPAASAAPAASATSTGGSPRSAGSAAAVLADAPELASALVDARLLAGTRQIPLSETMAALLSDQVPGLTGLPRGWRVSVDDGRTRGQGSVSLAMALMAETMQQGSWAAVVDAPWLGLAAVRAHDIPLGQLVLIDNVQEHWGAVMVSLIDGFDLVVFADRQIGARDARRVRAHAREKGTVLVQLGDQGWPESADLRFTVEHGTWFGLGRGHGHLTGRQVAVSVQGRRMPHRRSRPTMLWLPDDNGCVRPVDVPVDVPVDGPVDPSTVPATVSPISAAPSRPAAAPASAAPASAAASTAASAAASPTAPAPVAAAEAWAGSDIDRLLDQLESLTAARDANAAASESPAESRSAAGSGTAESGDERRLRSV